MRREQKGWEALRNKLQNASVPPPYPSWKQFHQNMQNNKDSWQYIGRKMRAYEHMPPNYIKQRIFHGGTIAKYSPLPVMLIGFFIGLLSGLLMTNRDNLYSLLSYNPDHITNNDLDANYSQPASQYVRLVKNDVASSDKSDVIHQQSAPSTFEPFSQDVNNLDNYSTLLADGSYPNSGGGIQSDNTHSQHDVLIEQKHLGVYYKLSPLPTLSPRLALEDKVPERINITGTERNEETRNIPSIRLIGEVHGGVNISRLAALSGNSFSNKVLLGFQTAILVGFPVYRTNVLYLALSKFSTRVSISVEGREYYNSINGTSLEIGGISRTGLILNGKPFYMRYGLMWTQFHGKGTEGIVRAGYAPGAVLAMRRFNGSLGKRFVWGWESGMSMLFRDVGLLNGIQVPIHFYVSTIISFKM